MSLIITIGCPGAGKSSWADANLAPARLRLERDRFREALFGSRRAYHESAIPREQRSKVVTEAMITAMDYWPDKIWAVTDTGLDYPAVEPFINVALDYSVPIALVVFDVPFETLLVRNKTRPLAHQVPDNILAERHEAFVNPTAWWRAGYYKKTYV